MQSLFSDVTADEHITTLFIGAFVAMATHPRATLSPDSATAGLSGGASSYRRVQFLNVSGTDSSTTKFVFADVSAGSVTDS